MAPRPECRVSNLNGAAVKRQGSLHSAIESHRAGRLSEAASLYRDVLLTEPRNAEALHLLGVLMHQIGQMQTAVELISRAVEIRPLRSVYHLSLGNSLLASRNNDGAIRSYRAAAACDPRCVDAHINLGNVALSERRYQEAAESYERAAACDPKSRDALVLLGVARIEMGDTERAVTALDSALKADPGHALAHMFRGYAVAKSGDYAGSLAFYREAIRLEPQRDEAHNNLGAAYEGLGRYAEAADSFAKALALKPSSVEYLFNVGLNMLRRRDRAGIGYLERAIALDLNHAEAHATLGEMLLAFGEYERGWKEYEWRWRRSALAAHKRIFHQPAWEGQPLEGRAILLHAEQGYGDTIQFARYIPEVTGRGGRVILEVQDGLHRLFSGLPGVSQCVREGLDPLPDFDVHCPLMSLPLVLGTAHPVPNPVSIPLSFASAASAQKHPLRIGLVWGGNSKHIRDAFRSMPLRALAPLRELPNAVFTCLQKAVTENAEGMVREFPMSCPLTPEGDFLETARIIGQLDLIMSVDTSVAHLAASMGKPTWLLLPEVADWRWGVEGESTVWYPSMTLFRQRSEGDWAELMERVVGRLREWGCQPGDVV